jgi:L-alanine-DL-glutamate epimerase-like enolase superfamily enzyme
MSIHNNIPDKHKASLARNNNVPERAKAHRCARQMSQLDQAIRAMADVARSYPFVKCFKLKVAGDEKVDAARVRTVIEARPDADIWLDANQSYRPIHMETFLRSIASLEQVRALEQPVPSVDWFGMKRVRERSQLPIAMDEGCFSSYDVARLAPEEFRKYLHAVELVSGVLLLFVGGLVFFNRLTWLTGKLTFLNRFNL